MIQPFVGEKNIHTQIPENNAVTTVNHSAGVENTVLIPKPLTLKNVSSFSEQCTLKQKGKGT